MFNVRAKTIYPQYIIQIGAGLTIILGLGFVRASCSVIEESRTFFYMGAITYRTMERPKNDTIITVVRSMRRQNICENFIVLQSVVTQLNLRLDLEEVEFDDDDFYCFPILLRHIYSAQIYNSRLYILCDSCVLHIIDLETKYHWFNTLREQPGFNQLNLWKLRFKLSRFSVIYHKYFSYMKKETSLEHDYIEFLKSQPETETDEKLNPETGDLIADILYNMEKENLLGTRGKETAIELKLATGTYICLLDAKHKLKRVFRPTTDDKK